MKKNTAAAPQFPLFYQKPEALDNKKHANVSLNKNLGFGFAGKTMAVPINTVEFPHIVLHYPIAFSTGSAPTPLAIVGIKDNQNLFVNAKGEWVKDTYVPAYVRRYPFILAQDDDKKRMALCVDNGKDVLAKGHKNGFFDKGKNTQLTENALEFCRSYQRAALTTEQFIKELLDAGLLIEKNAQLRLPNGTVSTLSGFLIIDEDKLRKLPTETLEKWHKNGILQLIYAQIMSMGNWQKLFALLPSSDKKPVKSGKKRSK